MDQWWSMLFIRPLRNFITDALMNSVVYSIYDHKQIIQHLNPEQTFLLVYFNTLSTHNYGACKALEELEGKLGRLFSTYLSVWLRDDFNFNLSEITAIKNAINHIQLSDGMIHIIKKVVLKYNEKLLDVSSSPDNSEPSDCDEALPPSSLPPYHGSIRDIIRRALSLPLTASDKEVKLKACVTFPSGRPMPHYLAQKGANSCLKYLLHVGVPASLKTDRLDTPLHFAAASGRKVTMKILLEAGASIKAKNDEGNTPLHVAAFYGRRHVIRWMLKNGADLTDQNSRGQLPIHWASFGGQTLTVSKLLDLGMVNKAHLESQGAVPRSLGNVNATDGTKQTLLHLAARSDNVSTLEVLVSRGANVKQEAAPQCTPIKEAMVWGAKNAERYLKYKLEESEEINIERIKKDIIL